MVASSAKFELHGNALPEDATVVAYYACEALSEPYYVQVDFCTSNLDFDASACLNQRMLLELVNERAEQRYFDGQVEEVSFRKLVSGKLHFRFVLRPGLAALGFRENSRIFQDQSVVDVVQTLLAEAGLDERVEWELSAEYPSREFIVQYRETTLNFVQRLLEEHGIFYFFKHDLEGHTLVFADHPGVFEASEESVSFALSQAAGRLEPLQRFGRKRSLRCTSVVLRDYDFRNPQVKPEAAVPATDLWPLSYYEYPAGFTRSADGAQLANARMAELRRDAETARGESRAIGLRCGGRFSVEGATEAAANGEYAVTRLVSHGKQELGAESASNRVCTNEFDAIPLGLAYAPPRRAHRPRILGIQTAVVTGAEQQDQSIFVDEFGRIKVRFRWDRVGQYDDNSSCFIRVNQIPLGGSMILPRVGWEVSVAFLEGDPDRPLVVGRLYNAESTPPLSLPDNKASGSLKSMSSPGGAGSNEITVGDSGGSQGFSISAQKDLNITTGHDCTEDIAVDDEQSVTTNVSRTVTVNDSATIGGNQEVNVGANLSSNIGGDQTQSIGGNDQSNATANFVENIGGSRSYTVGGNQLTISNGEQRTVKGPISRSVGAVQIVAAGDSITDNILGASSANAGAVRIHVVNGSHGEVVAGARSQTTAAAEVHLTSGDFEAESKTAATHLVGGIHYQKITGDFIVKAPMISLVGGTGTFKGGSSKLTLSGGPIQMKGSKISVKAAMVKKTSGSLKIG